MMQQQQHVGENERPPTYGKCARLLPRACAALLVALVLLSTAVVVLLFEGLLSDVHLITHTNER